MRKKANRYIENVNEENIKKITQEIDSKKDIPEEEMCKINKKVFENLIIADIVMFFFYFLILGSQNIETVVFMTDVKVFSIILIIITILLFEYSYRKEDSNMCIHGIETLILAILVLYSSYIYIILFYDFHLIIAAISFLFAIYYVLKSIIIFLKMKKKYYTNLNDINEIIKK
ncbi:MAG: hypothetical protein HFJ53_00200 [Clostridia bacterium]|jgi:hypothetical protein|nr:hypothetical protein [Clostridia bacterium]